jgi:translocation and assembly module TamB
MKRLPPLGLLLILLLGMALTFGLHSTAALRWGLGMASGYLPVKIEATSVEGGLAGPIHLQGLVLDLEGLSIRAESVDLDWWAGDLLRKRVNVKYLSARELVIIKLATSDDSADSSQATAGTPISLPVLPVGLDIKNISIDNLYWESAGQRQKLLGHFTGAGNWDAQGARIGVEELRRDDIVLTKSDLTIGADAPYVLDGTVNWRIPGLLSRELAGKSLLVGPMAQPRTEHTLLEPANATVMLDADFTEPTLRLTGTLDASDLTLRDLQSNWPAQAMTVHTTFTMNGDAIGADGSLQWAELPTFEFGVKTILEARNLQLLSLDVSARESNARLSATGYLALSADQASQLAAVWEDVDLKLAEAGPRLRSSGKADIAGTPDAYQLRISTQSQLDEYPSMTAVAEASGNRSGVGISTLKANLLGGLVEGSGRVDWQNALHAEAGIKASGLDPSGVLDAVSGSLDFQTSITLDLAESGTRLALDLTSLGGQVAGKAVAGQGILNVNPDGVELQALELQLGSGTISASGSLGDSLDFKARIKQLQVANWIPELGGTYDADLSLSGSRQAPRVLGSVIASEPGFKDWQADHLSAQLSLDVSDGNPSSVITQVQALRKGEQQLGNLELTGEGVAANHQLALRITGGKLELDGQLRGGYEAQRGWQGNIAMLQVGHADYSPDPWNLEAPTSLEIRSANVQLGKLCMTRAAAQACLTGDLADDAGNMDIQIEAFPLASLNSLFNETLELSGLLNASVQGQFNEKGQLTGKASLDLGKANGNWIHEDGEVSMLAVDRFKLSAIADQAGLRAKVAADLGENDNLDASLDLQRATGAASNWPAVGEMKLNLGDLSRYDKLIPDLDSLAGKLTTTLQITGSLNQPIATGTLKLENLETQLPELGTRITRVNIDLKGGVETNFLKIQAQVGDGLAQMTGDFKLLGGKPRANFHLDGENLTLVDSPKLFLQASPDLRLKLEGGQLDIGGKLTVPKARIEPIDLGNAVRSSPDVVIANANGQRETKSRLNIFTNVAVELGDEVSFDGYGLSARFTGNLRVKDASDKITTARGELNVLDGKYKLYGLNLDVERGQLLFAGGPIDTPGLNIRASRESDDVRVGVDVGGTLREPTLTMFSSPAMPQSEIVAYLLTGKPMADLDAQSGQKASALGDALSLAGGSLLTGEIGSRVGLDELALRTEGQTGGEELVLGKYVSPDLYLSYGISLYEGFNTIRIRYQLNDRLSLRTESGINKSVDLFWSAER